MKRKYWIKFTHSECPVCGNGDEYRERVYDEPKPKDPQKRHVFEMAYDYCDVM